TDCLIRESRLIVGCPIAIGVRSLGTINVKISVNKPIFTLLLT
ncbi:hypothetical protein LCGC14_2834270, partial [marine sediment metagenome]